jgi:hypothetical protein
MEPPHRLLVDRWPLRLSPLPYSKDARTFLRLGIESEESQQNRNGGMIRVRLIDRPSDEPKFVEFRAVPLVSEADFRCRPEGLLSFQSAVQVSREVQSGQVKGRIGTYTWYRQAVAEDNGWA